MTPTNRDKTKTETHRLEWSTPGVDGWDTITLYLGDDEIDSDSIESSEDEAPYLAAEQAMREAHGLPKDTPVVSCL